VRRRHQKPKQFSDWDHSCRAKSTEAGTYEYRTKNTICVVYKIMTRMHLDDATARVPDSSRRASPIGTLSAPKVHRRWQRDGIMVFVIRALRCVALSRSTALAPCHRRHTSLRLACVSSWRTSTFTVLRKSRRRTYPILSYRIG